LKHEKNVIEKKIFLPVIKQESININLMLDNFHYIITRLNLSGMVNLGSFETKICLIISIKFLETLK